MSDENRQVISEVDWNEVLESERFYTVTEVAERMNVNPETVRRWLRSGQLKGFQVARKSGWRIPASALGKMIEAMDTLGKPAA